MLLDLKQLIKTYNLKITGVIQVGAHTGGEIDLLIDCGIGLQILFEPCQESFDVLSSKIIGNQRLNKDSFAINSALGDSGGTGYINVEKRNNGQSNSILAPKKHKEYYPDILFEEREKIIISRLDDFSDLTKGCNFLMIDVQGYELEVLKGATETLKQIDYILTEVNREELYEGCPMVEDLDNYLTDFKRVKTKWLRKGWGDALYLKRSLL